MLGSFVQSDDKLVIYVLETKVQIQKLHFLKIRKVQLSFIRN